MDGSCANQDLHTKFTYLKTTFGSFTNDSQSLVKLWTCLKRRAQPVSNCLVRRIVGSYDGSLCVCTMDDDFDEAKVISWQNCSKLFHQFLLYFFYFPQKGGGMTVSNIFVLLLSCTNFLKKYFPTHSFSKNTKKEKRRVKMSKWYYFHDSTSLCVFRFIWKLRRYTRITKING